MLSSALGPGTSALHVSQDALCSLPGSLCTGACSRAAAPYHTAGRTRAKSTRRDDDDHHHHDDDDDDADSDTDTDTDNNKDNDNIDDEDEDVDEEEDEG